jgi:TonB family protein
MNRLQKKCFLVSAGSHLLLGVILVVGPAFLSSRTKPNDMRTLDSIPAKLIDEAFSNPGGSPAKPRSTTPTPPAPPVPAPPPPPPAAHTEPPPEREPVKPESLDPSLEPAKKRKPIELTPVTHHTNSHVTVRSPSETDERARENAHWKEMAAAFKKAASGLSRDVAPATTIEAEGNGTGRGSGEAYANYDQAVKSIYEDAWVPPDDASSENPVVVVTVTIASDGNVLESRIVKPSGDPGVDSSVRRTLERVTSVRPFPEGAKEKQRTYRIKFDLNAKRLQG